MRARSAAAVAAVAALGLAAAARAEIRPPYGGAVEATLLGEPVALDPADAQSHAEVTVVGLVFDTLYALGPDGAAEPHLALGPPVLDAARTTAHVAVRRGVQFHDQSVMTAADVADSLERVRVRQGWLLAQVAAVRAAGDGVDLVLRAPGIDVAPLLALPQTAIARRGQAPTAARPIGSGPFVIDGVDPAGKHLALRAFDDYFAGRPYLDRLGLAWFDAPDAEARRFEAGAVQLSARGQTAFAGGRPRSPAAAVDSPASVLVFVGFGRQHAAVTGEPAFRRALDLALDRGAVATIATGERTQATRLPLPGGPPLDPQGLAGNVAAARGVLDEAGRRIPQLTEAGRRALRLAIVVDETRPDDREIALRVSRGLDRLGVGFTIEAVPARRLRDRAASGDCDLWIGQIAAPPGVAAAWWGAAFAAGGDDWAHRQLVTGAIDAGAATAEFARRLPILPLMFRSLLIWHQREIHGLAFDASGRPGFADLYRFKGRP
jgi:MarR-like DNA-binding transcriptional regulator SgrR of sgrS sRNA